MRLWYYIVPVVLWIGMILTLIAFRSSHHRTHDDFVMLFAFAGIAASLIGLMLAFWKRHVAIGFGAFAILHGLGLPFLFWPNITFPVGLIMPVISIVVGLSAIILFRKKSCL